MIWSASSWQKKRQSASKKLMNECKLPDVTDVGHTPVHPTHLTHTSPNTIWEYTANFSSSWISNTLSHNKLWLHVILLYTDWVVRSCPREAIYHERSMFCMICYHSVISHVGSSYYDVNLVQERWTMVKIKAKDLYHDLAPFDHPHNCVICLLYDDGDSLLWIAHKLQCFWDRSLRPLNG